MQAAEKSISRLSRRWIWGVALTMAVGFSVLIWIAVLAYQDAPPIPAQVVDEAGQTLFTGEDIRAGQQVFLQYGLMENGTIWGHGAYLGPDFSAEYLHGLVVETQRRMAGGFSSRQEDQPGQTEWGLTSADAEVGRLLKTNRYDLHTGTLVFTAPEAAAFSQQISHWSDYFATPAGNGGLTRGYIQDPVELRRLTAFFAWAAWASVAERPGRSYSYTNNFPYEPLAGNTPTSATILWSALSLVTLLAGMALVLFAFGRFDYLGWKGGEALHIHPQMLPGQASSSQRATIKFFVIVSLLFLVQVLVGGALGHYRADPASFYGFDLAAILPSNILRTWHLQLAIFWIATSYVAGGLLLAVALGRGEPAGQVRAVHVLFGLLVVVVAGSLIGEMDLLLPDGGRFLEFHRGRDLRISHQFADHQLL